MGWHNLYQVVSYVNADNRTVKSYVNADNRTAFTD